MINEIRHNLSFEEDDIAVIETNPAALANSDAATNVIILVHGLGGQKNSETHLLAVQKLSDLGFPTFRFDFPGHGESGGTTETLTISKGANLIDHVAALARRLHPGSWISFLGASYGGTCILASSAIENARAIVLRSPVSDYQGVRAKQLGSEGLARWKKEGLIDGLISRNRRSPWAFYIEAGDIDLFARATKHKFPLLVVQGEKDDTVPMSDSARLTEAWGGRSDLVTIKGGDHSLDDPVHTDLFVALGCHWFTR